VPEPHFKGLEQYIRNATIKLYVNGLFTGTGFFISADGHVLTAYHCLGQQTEHIKLVTPFDGSVTAQLQTDKSPTEYDLAILKTSHQPSHYLPLARITREQLDKDNEVIAIGYPASHLPVNREAGSYKGYISRWRDDDRVELSDAVKGRGHSGGSVYHYASRRVVGVVTERYKEGVMVDSGLATRLDRLFEKWPELVDLNRETAQLWEQRLQALQRTDCKHPIVFAMLPPSEERAELWVALRQVFEEQWGCQVLTIQDRQYHDSTLGNLRAHLEQAAVFVAEVSEANPEVMFMLGAAQFALSQVPMVLLSRNPERLPPSLQGRGVVRYGGETTDWVTTLETQLSRIAPLQQVLTAPGREHFCSVTQLQGLVRLRLQENTWQRLQECYPTQEAWRLAHETRVAAVLGDQADLAGVVLKRVREGMP